MLQKKNIGLLIFTSMLSILHISLPVESSTVTTNCLVDVTKLSGQMVIDMRYATDNNFTGKKIYSLPLCALQQETAWKLIKANEVLMEQGYRIKIWDAYRPLSVQKKLWDIIPDNRYMANPYKGGSIHNKGCAVDITLVDMSGRELEMPSGFDDFTAKASRQSKSMTEAAKANLKILTDAMTQQGFKTINSEWWHFEDKASSQYTCLDIALEDIVHSKLLVEELQCIGDSEQVIIVTNDDPHSCKAKLSYYEKKNGKWFQIDSEMDAEIGKNGFKPVKNTMLTLIDKSSYKHEGDGCTPIGAYTIDTLFGWGENLDFQLPYKKTTENDYWVSDNVKEKYNVWINKENGPDASWNVYEKLKISPYKYAGVINYNIGPDCIVGNGSAIFIHLTTESGHTAGCIAVSEQNLISLFKWMNPQKHPLIVEGPKSELQKIKR